MAEGEAFGEILREMREVREQQAENERREGVQREAVQRQGGVITPWVDAGGEASGEPQELRWLHPTLGELRFVRAPVKVWVVTISSDKHEWKHLGGETVGLWATLAGAQGWVQKIAEKCGEKVVGWKGDSDGEYWITVVGGNRLVAQQRVVLP